MTNIELELNGYAPCSSTDVFKINGQDAVVHDFGFAKTYPLAFNEEKLMGACRGCELKGFESWDEFDEEYHETLKKYGLTPEGFQEVVEYLDNTMVSWGSCCMCD